MESILPLPSAPCWVWPTGGTSPGAAGVAVLLSPGAWAPASPSSSSLPSLASITAFSCHTWRMVLAPIVPVVRVYTTYHQFPLAVPTSFINCPFIELLLVSPFKCAEFSVRILADQVSIWHHLTCISLFQTMGTGRLLATIL